MDTSRPIFSIDDISELSLSRPEIINRIPQPDETGVSETATLDFELVDSDISKGIDTATLNVTVNGLNVIVNGIFQSGWSNTRSAIIPITAWWVRVVIDPVSIPSLTDVAVHVEADTLDAVSGSWDYSYQIEDKSSPQVLSAKAIDRKKVIVEFGQEIAETDATAVTVTFPWGDENLVKSSSNWVLDPFVLPVTKSLAEPFDVSIGEDLIVLIDGVQSTITMTMNFTTASVGASHLSALLSGLGADAIAKSGIIYIRSLTQTGSIQVYGGIANYSMKFDDAVHTKTLPYQTAEGTYSLTIIAQYPSGQNSLRTESFLLSNDDLVFSLIGSTEGLTDDSVLVVGNYVLTPDLDIVQANITPAFCPDVTSVSVRSSTEIELTLEYDMTPGGPYIVTVSNIQDPYGNIVDSDHDTASFTGFTPVTDARRSFAIYPEFPQFNRTEDKVNNFDLKKYISVFEEVLASTLYDIDEFREKQQISVAPEDIIDAILYDKGNPFTWADLTLYEKRKLAGYLVLLLRKKGTEVGIIDAVQLFFRFTTRPTIVTYWGNGWTLGVDLLGNGTTVEDDNSYYRYAFALSVDRTLTSEELLLLARTVNVMKVAREHFVGVYAPSSSPALPTFWSLGSGLLGTSTLLGE